MSSNNELTEAIRQQSAVKQTTITIDAEVSYIHVVILNTYLDHDNNNNSNNYSLSAKQIIFLSIGSLIALFLLIIITTSIYRCCCRPIDKKEYEELPLIENVEGKFKFAKLDKNKNNNENTSQKHTINVNDNNSDENNNNNNNNNNHQGSTRNIIHIPGEESNEFEDYLIDHKDASI